MAQNPLANVLNLSRMLLEIFSTAFVEFCIRETEPDAFFLDVFFNALPIHPGGQDSHDKRKNVLLPTRIAYAGGPTEFSVDMGPEVCPL